MLPPRIRRAFRLDVHDRELLSADVDDEIAFHIEERTRQLERRGLSPEAARAEAIRLFGASYPTTRGIHVSARRREDRMRLRELRDALAHDLRYTLRTLRASPGFTLVVALTLALGIGANTAIFSVIDAVLLRPLPYPSPERLVALGDGQIESEVVPASFPEFQNWRERMTRDFTRVGAWAVTEAILTGAGEPELLDAVRVSAELPAMLGVSMLRGRALRPEDDDRASERVVVLGERLWRNRFGADPDVVGRVLTLNGYAWTVVGVARADRRAVLPSGLVSGQRTDVWFPLRLDEEVAPRGLHFISVLGELRPGVSLDDARPRIEAVAEQLRNDDLTEHGIVPQALTERLVGDVRGRLTLLLGAVGLVLLIACANVANLLLARASARRREIAVRIAIGAGRGRVAAQLLIESVIRALIGGALGVGLAYAAVALVHRLPPGWIPRAEEIAVDGRVMLFALGLSVATGLLFGLVPALRAAGHDAGAMLRDGSRGMSGGVGQDRLRSVLVAGEVAMSFVLLAGAALLLQSFGRLASVETGFDEERTLTAFVVLSQTRYDDSTRQIAFYDALIERVSALPGVQGVAVASNLPVEGGTNGGFAIEGRTFPPDSDPMAEKRIVSSNYFDVLGARIVDGRSFDGREVLGGPGAMVVNESFARQWFPGESAVGKRVSFLWGIEGAQTVVGVVADIREGALDQPPAPAMYVSVAQRPAGAMNILVRTTGDPLEMVPALRREVLAIDHDVPISQIRTLSGVIAGGIAGPRLSATLVGIFSVVAMLLAAVGLYGVISYSVQQRTRELGIRAALGAQRGDVLRLVLGRGLLLLGGGLAVGTLLALALGRLIASQLFGIAPNDATTLASVGALLGVVGVAAAALPAMRATRIDPVVALREE